MSADSFRKVKVAIIGAGSAGLSAMRQVKEKTEDYVLIDQTPLGTKCARTGCMPSKALLIAADDFHRRDVFVKEGIRGTDSLHVDIPSVLQYVRNMRDHFTGHMAASTKHLAGNRLITGKGKILSPDRIEVSQMQIKTDTIIIATGSAPLVPAAWKAFGTRLLTSDTIFEQTDLPPRIAVIGLGPIGIELGQALNFLGIEAIGFDMKPTIGGITDPVINETALRTFKTEFPIYLNAAAEIEQQNNALLIRHPDNDIEVDAVLAAVGVKPNLKDVGLENLDIALDDNGMPPFNHQTMQIADLPVFIAGDANGFYPVLHEALDEGFIAGRNSLSDSPGEYCRRPPLLVVFSNPQIAAVGQTYEHLLAHKTNFIIGEANFEDQSRAVLEQRNHGKLHLYAEPGSAQILGAEMICSGAEHLAHLLALAVDRHLTVYEMLQMPFYHPTITEGLRTALQDAGRRIGGPDRPERLSLCNSSPEPPLG